MLALDERESEIIEYRCRRVTDVGGPDEPYGYCHADAVAVHRKEDTGLCFDHLPASYPMGLAALGHFNDRYWSYGVGPY